MDDVLRLTKKTKKKKSSMAKKRRRTSSVTDADAAADDPLKRLAAFRERMFDMKHDEKLSSSQHGTSASAHSEDAVVLAKWKKGKNVGKAKERKTMGCNDDEKEDDAMPRITIKKALSSALKKKEKVKKSEVAAVKSSTVKIPGSSDSAGTVKKSTLHAPVAAPNASFASQKVPQNGFSKHGATAATASAKPKKQVTPSASEPSKPVSSSVVTQGQLAMFEDVLSLEDPLEKAMQAVKEQMAASSSEKKSKFKENNVKKTEKRSASEDEQVVHTPEAIKEVKKKKKRAHRLTEDSAPEILTDAALAQAKTENVEVSSSSSTARVEQQQQLDAKASSSHKKAKRKRDAVDSQDADTSTSAIASSISTTTNTTVEVSVVTDAVTNPPESITKGEPTAVKLTASQKKAQKKKIKRARARANSLALSEAADEIPVVVATTSPAAVAQVAKMQPEVHAKPQAAAVKFEPLSDDEDEDESLTQAPGTPAKTNRVVKTEEAKPTVQVQRKTTTPAKQPPSQVVGKTEKDAKSAAAATKKLKKDVISAKSLPSSPLPSTKRQKVVEKSVDHRPRAQVSPTANGSKKKSVGAVSTTYQHDLTETEMNTESGDELECDLPSDDDESDDSGSGSATTYSPKQVFSNLIDEAARQQWDLVEVGRLVKLFCGQWGHKKSKTARFLRRFCPELVNIDFLEGLGVSLGTQHLVKIFERGSGNAVVLMNKLASAVENGDLHVRDPAFLNIVGKQVRNMVTNHEVFEFLVPLLESLSTVRDVSHLLKHVCEHWHITRTLALVQQILLTSVFDDLDGNQDEILKDLPQLKGKLDFPSRLDQEDADENGNLIGLVANEDSDLGEEDPSDGEAEEAEEALGEIHSEDEDGHEDDENDEDDEEPYEGETDSEEERAIRAQHRPKRRSRFILDEADEDDGEFEDDDDELETEDEDGDDDNGGASNGFERQRRGATEFDTSSESDSDDETWRSKPKS